MRISVPKPRQSVGRMAQLPKLLPEDLSIVEHIEAKQAIRSLLCAKKADALELPVDLRLHTDGKCIASLLVAVPVRVWSQPHSGDEVFIVTLGVLVDGAAVVSPLWVDFLSAAAASRGSLVVLLSH